MGAIQLKNVTKKFGDQMVIDDLKGGLPQSHWL